MLDYESIIAKLFLVDRWFKIVLVLEFGISFEPEADSRRRAEIASAALDLIFTPNGPWFPFTFNQSLNKHPRD